MADNSQRSHDERIRVLRVITRLNVGGPARQTVSLYRGLDPARYEHRILAGAPAKGEAGYIEREAPDVEVHHVPGLGRLVDLPGDGRALAHLVSEVRRFRPHIIHTHLAKAGLIGRLAALAGRPVKTVHTFHGHLLYGILSPSMTRAVVTTERILAKRTDRLISVGERVKEELLAERIGERQQFRVVAPGIDLGAVPPRRTARTTVGLDVDGRVVALVARLSRQKHPQRFVEIARRLSPEFPDVTFAIFGGGELEAELRLSARDLGHRVRFCGWRTDIEQVMAATDIVVLTSDNEGMPVAAIEAAQAGVPVVATDVGSTGEVVIHDQTGVVVAPHTEALVEGVRRLLSDPDRAARLGRAAAVKGRRDFGAARLVADIDSLYRELVPHP